MKNVFRKMCLVSLVLAVASTATVQAFSQWGAGVNPATSTAWETATNWNNVPAYGQDVYVTADRTGTYAPVINSAATGDFVLVGWAGFGSGNTTLTVNSGSLTSAKEIQVGNASVGTLTVNGGAAHAGWDMVVGDATGTGTLNVNGGTADTPYQMVLGRGVGSAGTLHTTAGTVNVAGNLVVGWAGGTGSLNMNGGTVNSNGTFWFAPDLGSQANINILDGVLNLKGATQIDVGGTYHVEIQKGTINWYNSLPNGPETILAWAAAGKWSGYGSGANIRASYDAGTQITTITAVPEPATMALLSLGGIAMLRRNRKK